MKPPFLTGSKKETGMLEKFKKTLFPLTRKNTLVFLLLWLFVGFSVGTGLLLGPVREITSTLRASGWDRSSEDLIVITIIVGYILGTFFVALLFARFSIQARYRHVSGGLFVICFCLFLGSLYLWFSPSLVTTGELSLISTNPRFTFGSYPTAEDINRLEQEGYTTVISLLHPAVVPFEPELIRRERKAIEKSGLTFIHLPMLPWVSDNRAALDSIRNIAKTETGKYYVHCYLGQDRIGTVRRIVESLNTPMTIMQADSLLQKRSITEVQSFERGPLTRLREDIYVSPYPTDDEFVRYIFSSHFKHVISLMNPENPDDVSWIEKERKMLANYQIPFSNFPVSLRNYDPQSVLKISRKIKELKPPVLIHGFLTPGFRSQAIIQAFRSDLPPLPPELFPDSISNSPVKIIAPNVAAGPRPEGPEFGSVLARKGIEEFIYLGQPGDSIATKDSIVTLNADIRWRSIAHANVNLTTLMDTLRTNGPWYLYGSGLSEFEDILESSLGPAIPDSITYATEKGATGTYLLTFAESLIPSVRLTILLTPPLIIYIFLAAWLAGYLCSIRNIATPYTRKIFHVFIFMMAGILQMLIDVSAVVLFGTLTSLAVLYAVYRGEGFPFYESMARPTDRPRRSLFIIIPLITTALGGLTANILFGSIAYIGYLVTGLGDAVGEPVGKRWGQHTYKVPSLAGVPAKRSLEGSAAVFFTSILVSLLALWTGGTDFTIALGTAFACGITAGLVEAVSNHGIDNFTIQVAATAVAYVLL